MIFSCFLIQEKDLSASDKGNRSTQKHGKTSLAK
jgi:hypothetical protein